MSAKLAKKLRQNATIVERRLWRVLRNKRFEGLRFRRQQPIGPYIVDFYCSAARLIIELDGSHHADGKQPTYDRIRANWLEARGYRVPLLEQRHHAGVGGNGDPPAVGARRRNIPHPNRFAVRPSLKGRVRRKLGY